MIPESYGTVHCIFNPYDTTARCDDTGCDEGGREVLSAIEQTEYSNGKFVKRKEIAERGRRRGTRS